MYKVHNMEIPVPQILNQDKAEILQISTKNQVHP